MQPERQEDKDQFVAKLYTFMEDCGSPINNAPAIYDEDLDLHKLFKVYFIFLLLCEHLTNYLVTGC